MKRRLIWLLLTVVLICSMSVAGTAANLDIDVDRDTNLGDLLYAMGREANVNIIINTKLENNVKGYIYGKDFYEALDYLALANNFNYQVINGTVLVGPADALTQMVCFPVRYANLEDIKKQLGLFIESSKIEINVENSSIGIDGSKVQIQKAEQLIKISDVPARQILLQVQMVEMIENDALQLGLNYQMPMVKTMGFSSISSQISWGVASFASEIITKGKVLAHPSLVTINGREAIVKMVDNYPILSTVISNSGETSTTVSYKDIGVTFSGTPRINIDADGAEFVSMKIHPIVSSIVDIISSTDGSTRAPQISSREAETTVRVKSGQTIAIGGLLRDTDIDKLTKIPGLGDLPLLGELFKYRDKRKEAVDVCIFVTPTILDMNGNIPTVQSVPDKQAAAGEAHGKGVVSDRVAEIFKEFSQANTFGK